MYTYKAIHIPQRLSLSLYLSINAPSFVISTNIHKQTSKEKNKEKAAQVSLVSIICFASQEKILKKE